MNLNIINSNKEELFPFPFDSAKDFVLGKEYKLNLIFVDSQKMLELNSKYRNLNHSTDILSFPLEIDSGEIYMCIDEAKKEAPKFDRNLDTFIPFLFIHGLVHLKGYDHGSKMESIEAEAREKFGV